MGNEFEKEIEFLEENKNIQDKLMTFALYFEISKKIESIVAEFCEEKDIDNLKKFLSASFKLPICGSNLLDKAVTPDTIIKDFLNLMKYYPMLSEDSEVMMFVEETKKTFKNMIKQMDSVRLIDAKDISLSEKVSTFVSYREVSNDVYTKLNTAMCRPLLNNVADVAYNQLKIELEKNSPDFRTSYKEGLAVAVKDFLIGLMAKKDIFEYDHNDPDFKLFFDSLTDDERSYFDYASVYSIAGYNNNNFNEFAIEIAKLMNKPLEETKKIILQVTIKSLLYGKSLIFGPSEESHK